MKNQNSYSTLLVERNFFLSPLYVGACVPCLLVPTVGDNPKMCHLEAKKSLSNMDVV